MKRTPLRRRTSLRAKPAAPAEIELRERVTDMVFARDDRCLLRKIEGACFGRRTPHHLRKRSQGGKWSMENVVTLCARHNDRVEDKPDHYHRLGLVVRRGEDEQMAWARLREAGLVDYFWDGEPWPEGE